MGRQTLFCLLRLSWHFAKSPFRSLFFETSAVDSLILESSLLKDLLNSSSAFTVLDTEICILRFLIDDRTGSYHCLWMMAFPHYNCKCVYFLCSFVHFFWFLSFSSPIYGGVTRFKVVLKNVFFTSMVFMVLFCIL